MASVPQDDFEKHLAKVKGRGEELTSAGVIRLAKRLTQPVGNSATAKPAEDGDPATDGEELDTVATSIAGMAAEEQSRANAITKPRDAAGVDKTQELSETSEPESATAAEKGRLRWVEIAHSKPR